MTEIDRYTSICAKCAVQHKKEIQLRKEVISKKLCYDCNSYRQQIKSTCPNCETSSVEYKHCCCPEEY